MTEHSMSSRPAGVPSFEDPTRVVQRAWSEIRLTQLQHLVGEAIDELRLVSPAALMGREVAPEQSTEDPIGVALEACCAELRNACGMVGASSEWERQYGLVRGLHDAQPLPWSTVFSEALNKYRSIASSTLGASFASASRPCKGLPEVKKGG